MKRALRVGALVLLLLVVAQTALLVDAAFWREPRSLSLGYVQVTTPSWPKGTAPLRIALISDVHVDNEHMPPERVHRIAETVNALQPDLIVLGGDYVGGLWGEAGAHVPRSTRSPAFNATIDSGLSALSTLKARYGVVAVIGNHDGWWDPHYVSDRLRTGGITVLQNASLRIPRTAGDVWMVGLADSQSEHPDMALAMRGVPKGAAVVGVGHNPGLFDWKSIRLPVLLSGHTHAGQVRLPWLGGVAHMSSYINEGFAAPVVKDGRVLVVTRGLGESGLPARFGSPPEILMVEIAPGEAASARRLS